MDKLTEDNDEIKFFCMHCGQRISTGSEAAGIETECPACCKSITVPASQENLKAGNEMQIPESLSAPSDRVLTPKSQTIHGEGDHVKQPDSGHNKSTGFWSKLKAPAFCTSEKSFANSKAGLAGRRVLGFMIDSLVALAILCILMTLFSNPGDALVAVLLLCGLAAFCSYFYLMEKSKKMATLGKSCVGLIVVSEGNKPLNSQEAIIRSAIIGIPFAVLVFLMVFVPGFQALLVSIGDVDNVFNGLLASVYIAYFSISLFTENNRAPHELVSESKVINKGMFVEAAPDKHSSAPDLKATPSNKKLDWRFPAGVAVAVLCTFAIISSLQDSGKTAEKNLREHSQTNPVIHDSCSRCDGRGNLLGKCGKCHGQGFIMNDRSHMQVLCPRCKGEGREPVPCTSCRGRG